MQYTTFLLNYLADNNIVHKIIDTTTKVKCFSTTAFINYNINKYKTKIELRLRFIRFTNFTTILLKQ